MYRPNRPDVTPYHPETFHIIPFSAELRKAFRQQVKKEGRRMSDVMSEMVKEWLGQRGVNIDD